MSIRQRCWLCVPVVLFCSGDFAFTLAGQDAAYWAGEYHLAQEANPLAHPFLAFHPGAFAAGVACWAGSCLTAILLLPGHLAVVTAFGLTVGHAIASASWLPRHGGIGWLLVVALLLTAERAISLSWKWAGGIQGRPPV